MTPPDTAPSAPSGVVIAIVAMSKTTMLQQQQRQTIPTQFDYATPFEVLLQAPHKVEDTMHQDSVEVLFFQQCPWCGSYDHGPWHAIRTDTGEYTVEPQRYE